MIKPAALLSMLAVMSAQAEELVMPAGSQPTPIATAAPASGGLPDKGESMQAVSRQFGEPRQRHAAVGGDSPRHPPITRWDYDGFSVFFENQHVIHAVRPDAPAPLARRDGLSGG
ncbi:hypothetical protein [Hydrocarboniphaga sp.]|uniref:Phosphodiesterase n=1 Tax=Hydrocarboniphaga effusa AP103 TaxID=1172194 RepID=I8T405_9GAMM|nr:MULTISPECIES: hypothetical protein [Hydrocarboniphaga]EIT68650.1 hypothetical protein WQQ_38450 [Hydrocarboniphaga effusa AP103]MDZ4076830.1 hypothetical protein [Hydrocarboniphaga sp.]